MQELCPFQQKINRYYALFVYNIIINRLHKLEKNHQLRLSEIPESIFQYFPQPKCLDCFKPKIDKFICIIKDTFKNLNLNVTIIQSMNGFTINIDNATTIEVMDDIN